MIGRASQVWLWTGPRFRRQSIQQTRQRMAGLGLFLDLTVLPRDWRDAVGGAWGLNP